ncbi:unnamed protein product [Prorocentrum cordatum]|uniref:Non-haem dioxygenase N-terminal domain-containing protein n=1 Tax=Prorocentrum cordatum TaxID=2364126 RepID=A0ABN9U5F1_9DINO|nr:unnamed protein product [Polarella glacialis]
MGRWPGGSGQPAGSACQRGAVETHGRVAMKFAEEDCMWASGATIRNTFIHYPTTSEDEDEAWAAPPQARPAAGPCLRARSAPAPACRPEAPLPAPAAAVPAATPHRRGTPCAKKPRSRRGAERSGSLSGSTASLEDHAAWETSTADSDGPGSEQGSAPASPVACDRLDPDCRATAERIVKLISEQCGFLLVRGHGVYPENGERMRQRGIAATLRFYVYGLPWAKRAKWLQPLQRSVAAVVQRTEPWVIVRGGVLFAPIDMRAARSPSGESRDQTLAEFYAARPDLPPGDHHLVSEALNMPSSQRHPRAAPMRRAHDGCRVRRREGLRRGPARNPGRQAQRRAGPLPAAAEGRRVHAHRLRRGAAMRPSARRRTGAGALALRRGGLGSARRGGGGATPRRAGRSCCCCPSLPFSLLFSRGDLFLCFCSSSLASPPSDTLTFVLAHSEMEGKDYPPPQCS